MEANLATVHEAIAAAVPEREAIVFRDRRLTFAQVTERSRRFANALLGHGVGCHVEREHLERHESGQDHVALYLRNGNEYLEAMLGSYKARAAPFNVNYRYVADELRQLVVGANARVVVYHAEFAPVLERVLDDLLVDPLLIQVADDSGNDLLPGAADYEELLAASSPERPELEWSPDDLYIAYTGGTTGLPKGVLWRQADIYMAAMGGSDPVTAEEKQSMEEVVAAATHPRIHPYVIPAPFMHVAGHWLAWLCWGGGNPVVIPDVVDRLDPASVLSAIERERAAFVIVVGNAFGRPLLEEMDRGRYDLSSLRIVSNGGAPMTPDVKQGFLDRLDRVRVLDTVGSSETGNQARHVSDKASGASTGTFSPGKGSVVLSEDRTRILQPGDDEVGWLARGGRVPLGYLGDPVKTAETFPIVDGVRWSVPGDRARIDADGVIHLLGRDSVCINTGGEKVFAEEVEAVLHTHPGVQDVVVCGRPSERWGSEVVALVQLRPGAEVGADELRAHSREHLAGYKVPKDFVFVDEVVRSPSGKADYRWAAERSGAG